MLLLGSAASGFLGPRLKVRPATPEERTAGRSECLINEVATVCAAAACMAALVVAGAGETRRAVRITDDSMEIL